MDRHKQEEEITNTLHYKLPKQHWMLRYSGFPMMGLIMILIMGLYLIQIPSFILVELHPTSTEKHCIAILSTDSDNNSWISVDKEITIILENSQEIDFRINTIKPLNNNTQLHLEAIHLSTANQLFLQNEYISIGKIKKTSTPLIWSLISI